MLTRGVGRVAARVASESLSAPLSCNSTTTPASTTTTTAAAASDGSRVSGQPKRARHQVSCYSTTPARLVRQTAKTEASHAETAHPPPPPRHRSSKPSRKLIALTLILTASGAIWYLAAPDALPTDRVLNTERFTPFDLVARETVSPTSFILTLRPSPVTFSALSPDEVAAQLAEPWSRHDLWAVEVKQPQLQIARDYTPLPPADGASQPDTIRLWIRAVDGGETSTYLSRLPVGSRVELRGPRGSFDLASRLGDSRAPGPVQSVAPSPKRKWDKARHREVVFLAGGTGIATALQAAHSLLDTPRPDSPSTPKTRVRILWAVRSQSDVQQTTSPAVWTVPAPPARPPPLSSPRTWWSFLTGARGPEDAPTEIVPSFNAPTAVTKQILDLKARHGDRLAAYFVVDDEGTYISAATVLGALGGAAAVPPPGDEAARCLFHSQALQTRMTDGAPNAGRRDLFKPEECGCSGGDGRPGKDLVLVSGPDGFIAAYAGAKQWEADGQVQGSVGGVLGELERRHPGLLKDWIVLKL